MNQEELTAVIATLKDGDWVEARFRDEKNQNAWATRGNIYVGVGGSLIVGNDVIRFNTGNLEPHLTSITKISPPVPKEPPVGSFGLLKDEDVTRRLMVEGDRPRGWHSFSHSARSWHEIFPQITKLYSPTGEPMEFEYEVEG